MKRKLGLLSLAIFLFSGFTNISYARTLSKKEYRLLLGAYLLGRGNKKRLIKLLNQTQELKLKVNKLETNQENMKKEIQDIKTQLQTLSDQLNQVLNLLNNLQNQNINNYQNYNNYNYQNPQENIPSSTPSQTPELTPSTEENSNQNIEEIQTPQSNQNIPTTQQPSQNELNNIYQEGLIPNKSTSQESPKSSMPTNPPETSLGNLNENTNLEPQSTESPKYNLSDIQPSTPQTKSYSLSDLTNDIENAIYYKGKGDMKTYKRLIKEMMQKYPDYRSKLEKCLQDPDYIFQLYIEVLNAESK